MKGTLSKFDRDIVPLCDNGIFKVKQYRFAKAKHYYALFTAKQL